MMKAPSRRLGNFNKLLVNNRTRVGVAGPMDLYLYNTSKCPKFPRWEITVELQDSRRWARGGRVAYT